MCRPTKPAQNPCSINSAAAIEYSRSGCFSISGGVNARAISGETFCQLPMSNALDLCIVLLKKLGGGSGALYLRICAANAEHLPGPAVFVVIQSPQRRRQRAYAAAALARMDLPASAFDERQVIAGTDSQCTTDEACDRCDDFVGLPCLASKSVPRSIRTSASVRSQRRRR